MTAILPAWTESQLVDCNLKTEAKDYRALRDGLLGLYGLLKDGETDFICCYRISATFIEVKRGVSTSIPAAGTGIFSSNTPLDTECT
jgi:hypothetical protein